MSSLPITRRGPLLAHHTPRPSCAPLLSQDTQTKKTLHTALAHRRVTRLVTFALLGGVIYLLWFFICYPYATFVETRSYDPRSGLWIDFSDCDVAFVSGPTPTVEYRVWRVGLADGGVRWSNSGGSTPVSYLLAGNGVGCDGDAWHHSCASTCRLVVTVTPAASSSTKFTLTQLQAEAGRRTVNHPEVSVADGVRLHELALGAWNRMASTASMRAIGATIGSLSVYMDHGRLWLANSTVGAITFESRQTASAYLLGVDSGEDDVRLVYRQPSNRVCFATDEVAGTRWVPAADPFERCDIRALLDGTDTNIATNNYFTMSLIRWTYDQVGTRLRHPDSRAPPPSRQPRAPAIPTAARPRPAISTAAHLRHPDSRAPPPSRQPRASAIPTAGGG